MSGATGWSSLVYVDFKRNDGEPMPANGSAHFLVDGVPDCSYRVRRWHTWGPLREKNHLCSVCRKKHPSECQCNRCKLNKLLDEFSPNVTSEKK